MKVKVEFEVLPFTVPNFVIPGRSPAQSVNDQPSIPLSAFDSYTLEKMCDDFRDAVFRKAGKNRPPQAVGGYVDGC